MKSVFFLSSASLGALILSYQPAMAQDAQTNAQQPPQAASSAAAEVTSVEDIIVTAQFRRQKLQDTPIAITAVTGETLRSRNQNEVVDIGKFTPNASLAPAAGNGSNGVTAFIRGIGQLSTNFAFEPGVGIYVDDVYFGTTFGANLDLRARPKSC